VHRELFYVVAEQVYLAGLTAFDIGACGLAQQYFVYALRLAQEGEDDTFAANVLAAMAHLANHHGQGAEGAQLAQAGLSAAARVANKVVTMRLSIALARAYALQGDSRACTLAIAAAEHAQDNAGQADEQRWARFLDFAYLLGEMAQCFLNLGQTQLAERFAQQSIEVNTGRHRRRVLSHAVLASARGRRGDREGAAKALTDTLECMNSVQSSRTLRALGDVITVTPPSTGRADPVIARAIAILGPRAKGACCPRVSIRSDGRLR
jgi:hypothetical protein